MMKIILLLGILAVVTADIAIHSPRGSNNRHRGNNNNDNVGNNKRLFKSWNNPDVGYNYGPPMQYYEGSVINIEWTNNQGCGGADSRVNCDIILQYMCSATLRDGLEAETITAETADAKNAEYFMYGMHEPLDYFEACSKRDKNGGLFIADRNLNGNSAQFTRQNPNGQTYGFECQEERDYYPYWHPTPWRDIAVLTSDTDRCPFYVSESQNVQGKGYCKQPKYNNDEAGQCPQADWKEQQPHNIAPPECIEAPWTRANHMGNTIGGYPVMYNWTVPSGSIGDKDKAHCVIRIRYNVSSNAYDGWNTFADKNEPIDRQGYSAYQAAGSVSPLINYPYVDVGGKNLSYAIDTRFDSAVFQDRTHEFMIKERPRGIQNRIHNLNVRGRRGNIVETFPAVEHDFVPTVLVMKQYEWLHPQWSGSDSGDGAGEGTDETERQNMVQLKDLSDNYPVSFGEQNLFFPISEAVRIGFGGMSNFKSCMSRADLTRAHNNDNDREEDPKNCGKLNLGGPYFDGGLQKMEIVGTFYYMSTRNNNFSNRSQKGTIIVEEPTCEKIFDSETGTESEYCPDPEDNWQTTDSANTVLASVIVALFCYLF